MTDENFSKRGALFGGWQPHARPMGHPLLEDTGSMRGGFESTATKSAVHVGNTQSYFKYHQSKAPRSKIPRRVMLKIREQDARAITKIFQSYLIGLLRARGIR